MEAEEEEEEEGPFAESAYGGKRERGLFASEEKKARVEC